MLVHGVGLYYNVRIDAHHKHDNNQVVTSIMKVLQDRRIFRGKLPPILRIQIDNCGKENNNIYSFLDYVQHRLHWDFLRKSNYLF
jgi:hypothetical protein